MLSLKARRAIIRRRVKYGKPRHVITDHGTQFYSVRGGTSSFDQYCHEMRIKHIMGGIAKPTTQGKIERFFHTLKTEYGQYTTSMPILIITTTGGCMPG